MGTVYREVKEQILLHLPVLHRPRQPLVSQLVQRQEHWVEEPVHVVLRARV